ncbi:MAG: hypothetical protein AB8C84_00655 [Oligoflexales bacterium]
MVAMKWVLLNLLFCNILLGSSEIIDILDKKTERILQKGKVFFPRNVSIVRMKKKRIYGVSLKKIEQMKGVHIFDGETLNWSWLMNGLRYQKMDEKKSYHNVFELTHADALLSSHNKKWDVVVADNKEIKKIYQSEKPKKIDRYSLKSWLTKAFGYNAMMIAHHNKFYYIKGFDSLKKGDQGVVFKESSDVRVVTDEEIVGIIEISHTIGQYGVGKVVLGEFLGLAEGTKLKIISKTKLN